jgi:guanyl-specific ribonuclease Sa
MMNFASGFCLCAVFGWLTVGAQVMPKSDGSGGSAVCRAVSSDWLSTVSSAANEYATPPSRNDVERQIAETDHAIKAMKHPQDAEEQKTVAQIRNYVTLARKALNVDDLDGADTLSAKAHVLLLYLSKRYYEQKARVLLIE